MLTKEQKKQLVKDLTEKFKASKSAVFADFKGLPVKDLSALKKELRSAGVEFKVAKKTLFSLASKEAGVEFDFKKLEGQIAVSFSKEDEIAAPKIVDKFAKTSEHLKISGGFLKSKVLTIEEVKALAKLPSYEEMLAKLVGTLQAPISGFVRVMAGNIQGLVQVLKAVSEKKA